MTKTELLEHITAKVESLEKKSEAEEAVNAIVDLLRDALIAGDSVILPSFGTFKVVERAARKGHNPQSHEVIDIPAKKVAKFVPTKSLKELFK